MTDEKKGDKKSIQPHQRHRLFYCMCLLIDPVICIGIMDVLKEWGPLRLHLYGAQIFVQRRCKETVLSALRKKQLEDPALISYLIFFSPDRVF